MFLDIALPAIQLCCHSEIVGHALRLPTRKISAGDPPSPSFGVARPLLYNVDLVVLVLGSFWRRRFVAKFAVSNSSAGIGDVATGPQGGCAEENHRNHEWRR